MGRTDRLDGAHVRTRGRDRPPALAFTEHLDHTVWTLALDDLEEGHFLRTLAPDGVLTPPTFDTDGYLEAIDRCRRRFPDLRILSGLELGEPHRHPEAVDGVLRLGTFDRVLGSLHCLPDGDTFAEPPGLFQHRDAGDVLRDYLAELVRLVTDSDIFAVVAHVDYPLRYWPAKAGAFDANAFEDEFRQTLRTIAGTGRALEINTARPPHETLLRWWCEEGGAAVTFGSDAHEPAELARGFTEATRMATAHGFRPGRDPYDFWRR